MPNKREVLCTKYNINTKSHARKRSSLWCISLIYVTPTIPISLIKFSMSIFQQLKFPDLNLQKFFIHVNKIYLYHIKVQKRLPNVKIHVPFPKNMHTHNQCLFSQCICKRSETVQTWPIRILPSKSSCPALSWDFLMADLSFLLFFCSISLPCCSVEVSLLEAGGVTSPVDWATSLKVWLVSSKDVCWWSDEFRWSELMVDGWDERDGGWDEGWDEVELVACVLAVEMLGWAEVELALTDLLVEMSLWCFSDPAWFGWTTFWWLDLSDFNFLNNMIHVLKSMPSITQFINNWESRKIPVHWTINQHSITSFSNIYWTH